MVRRAASVSSLVILKSPLVFVLFFANPKLVTILYDEGINVSCLVSSDQLGIRQVSDVGNVGKLAVPVFRHQAKIGVPAPGLDQFGLVGQG